MTDPSHPILLFDGVCNLCNRSVQFVIRHDAAERFRFAALQSNFGKELLEKHGLSPNDLDTVVLIHKGRAATRSDAALKVLHLLGWPWSMAAVFLMLPKGIRDAVYRQIARNRYRWFGQQEQCMIPTPELTSRFLDQ